MNIDPREVINLEGCTGIQRLNQIATQFGYKRQPYEDGAPILEFLRDNPGASEAILNWLVNQPNYLKQIEKEFDNGVELSRDVATKLMEAFGPCSVLYETMSVDDIIKEIKGAKSLAAFCKLYLSVEDVEGEKAINAAYHEESSGEERYKGRHQQAVASRNSFEQEMKKRVVDFLKSQGESLEA